MDGATRARCTNLYNCRSRDVLPVVLFGNFNYHYFLFSCFRLVFLFSFFSHFHSRRIHAFFSRVRLEHFTRPFFIWLLHYYFFILDTSQLLFHKSISSTFSLFCIYFLSRRLVRMQLELHFV